MRQTAARFLEELVGGGLLEKQAFGKHSFFINRPLVNLFATAWHSA